MHVISSEEVNYFEIWKSKRDFLYYLLFLRRYVDEAGLLSFISLFIANPFGAPCEKQLLIKKVWITLSEHNFMNSQLVSDHFESRIGKVGVLEAEI